MKAVFDKETHYYKYVYNEWTQPTLTANNSFKNGFAANSNYDAYSPNSGNIYVYGDEVQAWIRVTMRTEQPFIATKFEFTTSTGWGAASGAYSTSFQGSNDGTNWTTIGTAPDTGEGQKVTVDMSSNTTSYKYFKLNVRNGGWAYEDALSIYGLKLFGKMRSTAEGTSSDYDYKIEGGKTYIVKEENVRKYYAIKSYTKGEYYGN